MDAFHERLQPYISLDRVEDENVREYVKCYLCHGLLWNPVGCENCDTTFCSSCIQTFHTEESEEICPQGCATYKRRQNPPTIMRLLANLKITCRYKSNGCTKILSYNELEEHESRCDYQLLICDGCEQAILKQNFHQHQNECGLLSIICDQCSTSFKREKKDLHTLIECLRIQVQQQKSNFQQLEKLAMDQQIKIQQMEQQLKQNNNYWARFFVTISEANEMCDNPSKRMESQGHQTQMLT